MHDRTRIVRFDAAPEDPYGPTSTPIYQTATFEQERADEFGRFDYTRTDNPTRAVLEAQVARLERADRAFAFSSGMASLATLLRLVPAGAHVIAGDDLYGGTHRLLERVSTRAGVRTTFADLAEPDALAAALEPSTRLVLVETPTNPRQRIADLRALALATRQRGILLAVDNTLASPYLQNPLELGADVVVHSATKHLAGHGDATAGILCVRDAGLAAEVAFLRNAEGNALAPFEAWLCLRGLKTLALRIERAQENARAVARFLDAHALVRRVHWPGLATHPRRALHEAQARGPGSLVSFETGDAELSRRIVESLECFTIAVSFGSTNSSASLPCRMSHRSVTGSASPPPPDLVRLSIGIEDERDLVADLARAFARAAREPEMIPSAGRR